jgi:hypothetical protein
MWTIFWNFSSVSIESTFLSLSGVNRNQAVNRIPDHLSTLIQNIFQLLDSRSGQGPLGSPGRSPPPDNLLANGLDDRPNNREDGERGRSGAPEDSPPASLLANGLDDRPNNREDGGKGSLPRAIADGRHGKRLASSQSSGVSAPPVGDALCPRTPARSRQTLIHGGPSHGLSSRLRPLLRCSRAMGPRGAAFIN